MEGGILHGCKVPCLLGHANDLVTPRGVTRQNAPAKRILAGEVEARHRFTDHRNPGTPGPVGGGEASPTNDRGPDRFEVPSCDLGGRRATRLYWRDRVT